MPENTKNRVLPDEIYDKDITIDDGGRSKLECKHFFLPAIIILMLFGNIIMGLADTQYGYYAFQKRNNITSDLSKSKQSLCEVNKTSTKYMLQQNIQSKTAVWNAYCHLAQSVPVLIMAMMVGSWSDKIGRRASLYIPTFGILFKAGFFALAITFNWDIYTFIIPFFVDGLCGTWISLLSTAYSYAADLTKAGKNRLFGVVAVEVILGFGVVVGTFTSGFVLKYLGFLYGSVLVTGICMLNCIFIFCLPESVKSTSNINSISQVQYLKNAVSFYIKKDQQRWKFQILALVVVFNVLPNVGRINIQSLFVMNSPFCWNSVFIGYLGAVIAAVQMIVGVGLSPLLYKFMSKETMVIAGCISQIGYYILTAFATNGTMLFMTPVVGILGNFPLTVIRTLLSILTPNDKQGALFGSIAAIDAACSLIGSVTANLIYSETVKIFRGLILIVFAISHLIGLSLFIIFLLMEKNKRQRDKRNGDNERTSYGVKLVHMHKF